MFEFKADSEVTVFVITLWNFSWYVTYAWILWRPTYYRKTVEYQPDTHFLPVLGEDTDIRRTTWWKDSLPQKCIPHAVDFIAGRICRPRLLCRNCIISQSQNSSYHFNHSFLTAGYFLS